MRGIKALECWKAGRLEGSKEGKVAAFLLYSIPASQPLALVAGI
jgi:hypothetical protein